MDFFKKFYFKRLKLIVILFSMLIYIIYVYQRCKYIFISKYIVYNIYIYYIIIYRIYCIFEILNDYISLICTIFVDLLVCEREIHTKFTIHTTKLKYNPYYVKFRNSVHYIII